MSIRYAGRVQKTASRWRRRRSITSCQSSTRRIGSWTSSNWQPICRPCHARKTATETRRRFMTPEQAGWQERLMETASRGIALWVYLFGAGWQVERDPEALVLQRRHYSARAYRDGRRMAKGRSTKRGENGLHLPGQRGLAGGPQWRAQDGERAHQAQDSDPAGGPAPGRASTGRPQGAQGLVWLLFVCNPNVEQNNQLYRGSPHFYE